MFANLQGIVDSEGAQTEAVYFDRTTDTVTNSRTAAHAGSVGSSNHTTLSFTPYVRNFKTSMKDAQHNVLGANILANEIYNAALDIHKAIETDSLAWLESNKTTVNSYSGGYGTFDATNHIFDIANGNQDLILNIIASMMRGNDYNRNLDLVYSPDLDVILRKLRVNGATNADNTAYQFASVNWAGVSNGFVLDADERGEFFAMETGLAAMVARIPLANRLNTVTKNYEYLSIPDPLGSGMTFAIHKYEAGDDTGNYKQDVVNYYQVSVDIARGLAPLSTAGETVVFKGSLLSA